MSHQKISIKSAFFVQMDDSILRLDIPMAQKVVLGAIVGLSREYGYCYAGNLALSKLLYTSESSIKNTITRLYKTTNLKNIGNNNARKLVFTPLGKIKIISKSQNETLSVSSRKTKLFKSQNESFTYYIKKYKINIGQTSLDLVGSKEFFILAFNHFWFIYPKKVKKIESQNIFNKLKLEEIDKLFTILPNISIYHNNSTDTFIPSVSHPTTFLRGKRWEDEVYQTKKSDDTRPTYKELDKDLGETIKRFKYLSDGDDIHLEVMDLSLLTSLNLTQEEAIDIANVDGFTILKNKLIEGWNNARI